LREVKSAWEYCGKEFLGNDPFINRKAWEKYLTKVKSLTNTNARKILSNDPKYLVGKMIEGGSLERLKDGFIIVDSITSSVMKITNPGKFKPTPACDNDVISQISQDDVEYEQPSLPL